MTTKIRLTTNLSEAIESLAVNLLSSAPFLQFQEARKRLDADAQARGLLDDLATAQTELRARQASSLLKQGDIAKLRTLQAEAQANRRITEYIQAQDDAVAYLQETNQEISQWLGVDFAGLARRSGGC